MGNRSFLYITRPKDKTTGGEEFADANNNLPILWQVLLAAGSESEAIDDQRVFGDAKTPNLAADANAGLARFKKLADYLIKHPEAHKMQWLPLYCDAVAQHLQDLIDAYSQFGTKTGKKGPIFTANLDELSWLEDDSSENFISKMLAECDELWANLESAITLQEYDFIEEYLGFELSQQKFTDWNAWAYEFGFCNFQHPYFQAEYRGKPQNIAFEEFDASVDDISLLEFFEEKGKWGVKTPTGQVILPPTYDEIYGFDERTELSVVQLGGQFGYIDRNGKVKIAVALQDAYDFFGIDKNEREYRAIAKKDGLYGLINITGDWAVAPTYQNLKTTDDYNTRLTMQQNGLWGVMAGDGKILLAPSLPHNVQREVNAQFYFTQADDKSPKTVYSQHFLPLKTAPEWQLSKADDNENYMIEVATDGKTLKGLMDETGTMILEPEYTELEFYQNEIGKNEKWYYVVKNKKHGLYQLDVGWQLDCAYDLIAPANDPYSDNIMYSNNIKRIIRFVKKDKKWGIYDAVRGAWLLGCEADSYKEFHKQLIGIYYGAKHEKSGWWVHAYAGLKLLAGPYNKLFELKESYLNFSRCLTFKGTEVFYITADGVKAINAPIVQPLNQKYADLILQRSLEDFNYFNHQADKKSALTEAEWALIASYASAKGKMETLAVKADALFEAEAFSQALVLYLQMAEQGHVGAMVRAGYIFETSKQDFVQAHDWYKRAVDAGNLDGKNNYASMLFAGQGCKANVPLAMALFKEASDAGSLLSSKNLADIYYENEKFQDYALALSYYLKAYKEHPQNETIGFIYHHLEDYGNAEKYYKLAFKDGSGYALLALGNFMAEGILGKVDIEKARNYYLQAQKTSYEKEATAALAKLG